MGFKNLYIIRHGETEYNRQNIVQGSGVDMPLNETGIEQADLFYNHYKNHPFDAIYTSALIRSQQSVASFINKGLRHYILPELNEIGWGDFEGKQQSHDQKAIYWEMINKWNSGDYHSKIENGESPFQMQQRQKLALQQILQSNLEKEVLICMHGRAMKSFLCLLMEMPLSQMEEFPHTNLCLYYLQWDGSKFEMIKHNDTKHLQISIN